MVLVKALAWPCLVFGVLWSFRKELRKLIPRLARVRGFWGEAEFHDRERAGTTQ